MILSTTSNAQGQQDKDLPKVELHLHLDCSLSYEVVNAINPNISYDVYKESFIAPPKCTDLADYITRAIKGFELMQTKEQLRLVTLDLFKQLKEDHVVYAEIRFAPLQHVYKGLTANEVVEAVNQATEEGIKKYEVEAGIILCTLRHYTEAQSLETAELVKNFKDTHIVGFDIAADEAGFPIDNHIKAFSQVRQNGIPCTAHAGEAKGAGSVWETLQKLHPQRIGHGVRSAEDKNLLLFLKENDIHLEICPTSNIQTNVFDKIENHPLNTIYNSGVSMGLNTDARTISNVSLSSEYGLVRKVFNWDNSQLKKCNLEAINHSFAKEDIKRKIRSIIEVSYK
ncbi:MAG: adenosine deaminase [Chitinophagaceae bacterium BSSC1]|nr:MAG: adenosine deaminase [Chitinophagaceae bacterium BSSC1]